MKHTPISTTEDNSHRVDNFDSRNLNAIGTTGLTSVADRHRSQPVQLTPPIKPLVSIWVGLGVGIIIASVGLGIGVITASIAVDRDAQATSTDLDIANTRIIASTQGDVCIAQDPIKEAQVALSLSQAHLVQANTNLQKFQSDYSRYKALASQGKATDKQLQAAKVAYNLAQLQKSSALKGLQHAQAQLAAVRVENC
jgi:F0F1-type ATP synthase membrane subunit c/vacuolar-type H+-ATPase subunit K